MFSNILSLCSSLRMKENMNKQASKLTKTYDMAVNFCRPMNYIQFLKDRSVDSSNITTKKIED
jgi:hypothetical protein